MEEWEDERSRAGVFHCCELYREEVCVCRSMRSTVHFCGGVLSCALPSGRTPEKMLGGILSVDVHTHRFLSGMFFRREQVVELDLSLWQKYPSGHRSLFVSAVQSQLLDVFLYLYLFVVLLSGFG